MALLSHLIIWFIKGVGLGLLLGLLALKCLRDHPSVIGSDHLKSSAVIGIILLMILLLIVSLR
jgi:hypothetical protein